MGDISWGKRCFFVAETLGFTADMGLPVQLSISGTKTRWNLKLCSCLCPAVFYFCGFVEVPC